MIAVSDTEIIANSVLAGLVIVLIFAAIALAMYFAYQSEDR